MLQIRADEFEVGIEGAWVEGKGIKEINKLVEKNQCFVEIEYESLTQDMKCRVLPLLVVMVLKRSIDLKTRGYTNRNLQRMHTGKMKFSSSTSEFFSLKYACSVITKECQDAATVDPSVFFLQA